MINADKVCFREKSSAIISFETVFSKLKSNSRFFMRANVLGEGQDCAIKCASVEWRMIHKKIPVDKK